MKTAFLLTLLLAPASPARAAEPLQKLARRLQEGLESRDNRKIAVLGFPYPDGAQSSGSTIVQERLTTYLAQGKAAQVIERARLQAVLEELRLERSGVVDARTSHELGRILGVGAVVTGTLNDLPNGLTEVNARLIETETGKVLSAGRAELERTWSVVHEMFFGGPAPRARVPRYRALSAADLLADSDVQAEKLLQSAQDAEQSPNTQPQDIAAAWCGLAQYRPGDRLNVKAMEACERWREYAEYWQNMRDRFNVDYEKLSDYLRLKRKTRAQKAAAIRDFLAAYGDATKDWPVFFQSSLESLEAQRESLSREAAAQGDIRSGPARP